MPWVRGRGVGEEVIRLGPTGCSDSRVQQVPLKGEVPSPVNPPEGCRFHPRCPDVLTICSQQEPRLLEIEPGHQVACHLFT